jgi:hypothetical protein
MNDNELKKQEQNLSECASKVENDEALNAEMNDWNTTINDGIEPDLW